MSNAALRYELDSIRRENSEIAADIAQLSGNIVNAKTTLDNTHAQLTGTLTQSTRTLTQAHANVVNALEMQGEIDFVFKRMKQMELANKRIRECNNKRYYDFRNYRNVRKIVQGLMDNFDFELISESLIEKAVERNYLDSIMDEPDYWLSSAMLAMMAWLNDDKERAERALAKALDLDAHRTASFFLVMNLRLNREESALKWFETIVDSALHGEDSAMILLFFSMLSRTLEDSISDQVYAKVTQYIRRLITISEEDGMNKESAVNFIIQKLSGKADDFSFPYDLVAKHCTWASDVQQSLALARTNISIAQFLADAVNVDESVRNEFLKYYMDKVIGVPCATEEEVYDEINLNELIIKYEGDTARAHEEFDNYKVTQDSEFNILSEMVHWVYEAGESTEVNEQMRTNMLKLTKELQLEAFYGFRSQYQQKFSPVGTVVVDNVSMQGDVRAPDELYAQADAQYSAMAVAEKGTIKPWIAIVALVVGIGIIVGGIFVHPALCAVGGIGIIYGAIQLFLNERKKKDIDASYGRRKEEMRQSLYALSDQWKKLEEEMNARDADFHQIEEQANRL